MKTKRNEANSLKKTLLTTINKNEFFLPFLIETCPRKYILKEMILKSKTAKPNKLKYGPTGIISLAMGYTAKEIMMLMIRPKIYLENSIKV